MIPCASTPTTRRVPLSDAAAIPQSVTISCVGRSADRRQPADRPLRADPDLGLERPLPLDDARGDVLREHLDEQRLAGDDDVDRLLEELGEARHVHALLVGGEVDRAVDDRRHDRLRVAAPDPHRLLHAADAGARERERDLGRRGLEIVVEAGDVRHAAHRTTIDSDAFGARPRTRPRARPGSAQKPREAAVLEDAPTGLALRAVVDRVLLEVDAQDRAAALRTRLAEAVVDDVDVLVALSAQPQLERARRGPRASSRPAARSPPR